MNFSRILITTDFSKSSNLAIELASKKGFSDGSEIILLHVNQMLNSYLLSSPELGAPVFIEEQNQISQKLAEDQLQEIAKLFFPKKAVKSVVLTTYQNVANEVAEYAEKENCDLIMLASKGHTALGSLFIGSVAQRIQLLAKCPILIIPING